MKQFKYLTSSLKLYLTFNINFSTIIQISRYSVHLTEINRIPDITILDKQEKKSLKKAKSFRFTVPNPRQTNKEIKKKSMLEIQLKIYKKAKEN